MGKSITVTNKYKRDYRLMTKQGKDMRKLNLVVSQLAEGKTLSFKYKDHALSNNWLGCRDCHIEPDWVLIYKTSVENVTLHRTGSHSTLFKI